MKKIEKKESRSGNGEGMKTVKENEREERKGRMHRRERGGVGERERGRENVEEVMMVGREEKD